MGNEESHHLSLADIACVHVYPVSPSLLSPAYIHTKCPHEVLWQPTQGLTSLMSVPLREPPKPAGRVRVSP